MTDNEKLIQAAKLIDPKAWELPHYPHTYREDARVHSLEVAESVLALFRRSEVPEPQGAVVTLTAEAVEANREYIARTQGEPSDAQDWNCGKCDREEALGHDDGQIPTHHRSCQSDVKLLAAANAYMHYSPPYDDLSAFSAQFLADMRAALRAAGGVR